MTSTAFAPIELGDLTLSQWIAMSPMTRGREYGRVPADLMAEYYPQRASAALIITEGTQPSVVGQGHPNTPGRHGEDQIRGRRKVTDTVHTAGGRVFVRLVRTGRVGHPSVLPEGVRRVAPSPVPADVRPLTDDGMADTVVLRELDEEGIATTIADFAQVARNAIDSGFDGVELHGANGISPGDHEQRRPRRRVRHVFRALVTAINPIGSAYLHIFEGLHRGITLRFRKEFEGRFILNPSTPEAVAREKHFKLIEDGTADILGFGSLFLANPGLPARLAVDGPFLTPDGFYGGDHRGCTDYPKLERS